MNRSIYLSQKRNKTNPASNMVINLHQDGYSYDFSMLKDHNFLCIQDNRVFAHEEVRTTYVNEYYDTVAGCYKFVHAVETYCGLKGLLIADKMNLTDAVNLVKALPIPKSFGNPLDAVTYKMIVELLDKRSRGQYRLLVRFKDKILPVSFTDIAFFYLENELTQLVTFDGKSYIIQKNLDELGKQGGLSFFRANRQYLVNRAAIKDLSTNLTRCMTVNLNFSFPTKIDVSKNKSGYFLEWLSLNH
jgi:hypothetical protein